MTQKILVTGASGQLGQTLQQSELARRYDLVATSRSELDITSAESVRAALERLQPDVIINTAAYTAVDAAENDAEEAYRCNATGPENLAGWAAGSGAYLIHLSTDFVFNGLSSRPYLPQDPPDPLGVYGASKLAGEQVIQQLMPDNSMILRTSWVYSPYGRNFMKTMLRLMREKDALNVVDDQIGTPCSTATLSQCIAAAVEKQPRGMFHCTDAGVASWYDFAVAIQEEALVLGLLSNAIPVHPISSSRYPTPARRPAFSVLDKTAMVQTLEFQPLHWRQALRQVLLNYEY